MTLLFLGPLPPPLHGFSAINQAMLDRLRTNTEVAVFDRSRRNPSGKPRSGRLAGFVQWLTLIRQFSRAIRQSPAGLYAGLSGGLGQALDLPFLLLARLYGVPISLHHHSYAYLNKPSLLTAAVFKIAAKARHICLCSDMSGQLIATYGLDENDTVVISNAAYMEDFSCEQSLREETPNETATAVSFGFLSNITAEKGIFDFFEASDAIHHQLPDARGLIAGPVSSTIIERFRHELSQRPWLTHVGPVYEDAKANFYRSIDLLLFPTRYENEAEPVTILEAMRSGVTVVAARRGCIAGMLDESGNCKACSIKDFTQKALEEARVLGSLTLSARRQARSDLASVFVARQKEMKERLRRLIQDICTN